ncbi:MAG: SpoVA/SpoVAEb family sporulation membrane protein, partial [Niameybacter sp.]
MADVNRLKKDYQNIVDQHSPKNKVVQNSFRAFWVGGTICAIGQLLTDLFIYIGFSTDDASMLCTICLILASAVLTGL